MLFARKIMSNSSYTFTNPSISFVKNGFGEFLSVGDEYFIRTNLIEYMIVVYHDKGINKYYGIEIHKKDKRYD